MWYGKWEPGEPKEAENMKVENSGVSPVKASPWVECQICGADCGACDKFAKIPTVLAWTKYPGGMRSDLFIRQISEDVWEAYCYGVYISGRSRNIVLREIQKTLEQRKKEIEEGEKLINSILKADEAHREDIIRRKDARAD